MHHLAQHFRWSILIHGFFDDYTQLEFEKKTNNKIQKRIILRKKKLLSRLHTLFRNIISNYIIYNIKRVCFDKISNMLSELTIEDANYSFPCITNNVQFILNIDFPIIEGFWKMVVSDSYKEPHELRNSQKVPKIATKMNKHDNCSRKLISCIYF